MPDNKRSFIAFLNKVRLSVMLRGKKIENAKLEKLSKKYTFVNYRVCEDLVSVAVGSEYFHVDLEDTPAYAERFDDVSGFRGGVAWVCKNFEWFHIRRNGSPANSLGVLIPKLFAGFPL